MTTRARFAEMGVVVFQNARQTGKRMGRSSGRFTSRTDAMNRRVAVWTCQHCGTQHAGQKPTTCKGCSRGAFHYFASRGEAQRYAQLELLQAAGQIKRLRVQVPFRIKCNGILVTTYYADFVYDRVHANGIGTAQVIEDYKGSKDATTDTFKLKKKLVEAVYGVEIHVVTN